MIGPHNIQQKVGACSKLGRMQGSNVGVILPSSACSWRRWSGSFGTPPRVSRKSANFLGSLDPLACRVMCVIVPDI